MPMVVTGGIVLAGAGLILVSGIRKHIRGSAPVAAAAMLRH